MDTGRSQMLSDTKRPSRQATREITKNFPLGKKCFFLNSFCLGMNTFTIKKSDLQINGDFNVLASLLTSLVFSHF